MTSPWLSSLHIYPVKSAQGPAPEQAVVEPWGLSGDRRWMLVDEARRSVTQREEPRLALVRVRPLDSGGIELAAPGMRPLRVALPDPAAATAVRLFSHEVGTVMAAPEAGGWFQRFLGSAPLRLAHLDDPATRRPLDPATALPGETVSLADSHPLLLTTTASLAALNAAISTGEHPGEGPLPMDRFRPNVVIDGAAPWAEDDWLRVRIGEVVFRVAKPCARCLVTTTDQASGERGREPLRALARYRRFGDGLMFGQNLVPESRGTLHVGDALAVLE